MRSGFLLQCVRHHLVSAQRFYIFAFQAGAGSRSTGEQIDLVIGTSKLIVLTTARIVDIFDTFLRLREHDPIRAIWPIVEFCS